MNVDRLSKMRRKLFTLSLELNDIARNTACLAKTVDVLKKEMVADEDQLSPTSVGSSVGNSYENFDVSEHERGFLNIERSSSSSTSMRPVGKNYISLI